MFKADWFEPKMPKKDIKTSKKINCVKMPKSIALVENTYIYYNQNKLYINSFS